MCVCVCVCVCECVCIHLAIIFNFMTCPSGITQDIFRDTTYFIDNGRIGQCGGKHYIFVETVPVHGLAVDWVANNLYWIRTDNEVSFEIYVYT